jgi:hypothetical protein
MKNMLIEHQLGPDTWAMKSVLRNFSTFIGKFKCPRQTNDENDEKV